MTTPVSDELLTEYRDGASWKAAVTRIYRSEMPETSEPMSLLAFHFQKLEIITSHLASITYGLEIKSVRNLSPFWAIEIPMLFMGSILSANPRERSILSAHLFWDDFVRLYRHLENPKCAGPRVISGARLLHVAATAAYADVSGTKKPLRGSGWGLSEQELIFALAQTSPIVADCSCEEIAFAIKRNMEEAILRLQSDT